MPLSAKTGGIPAAVGVAPTGSISQHVASKQAGLRAQSANTRASSAKARRSPQPTSSHPPQRRSTAEGGSGGAPPLAPAAVTSSNAHGNARRRPRAASAHPTRHVDSNPVHPHAGQDVAYLYQQLQDALRQQSRVEEERQRRLMQYRRRLRSYCDENATLRNIIHAGEGRRRDAAVAVAESMSGGGTAGPLRAHGGGHRRGPASVTEAEMEVVEQRTHLARQRHNRLSHDVRVNKAALAKEEEAQATLTAEAGAPLDPASLLMGANRPIYLRMVRLEHLLNEVLQRQSTVGVVLKNYGYHLKTLRDEATQYDVQQRLLESEYAERHRDHLQLLGLYDTARAAYDDAVNTRAALQQSGAKMRAAKEKALQQKRRDVEKELAATQLQERRAVDLQQQLEEETQLLEAAENTKAQLEKQRLNSRTALTLLKAASAPREATDDSGRGADERLSAFEVAFRDMLHVANAGTLDELVATYRAEMAQQCKLQDDLDELRDTRTSLQQETHMLRERVQQTKYCVGAGTRFGAAAAPGASGKGVGSSGDSGGWRTTTAASPLMAREMETFLREEKETLAAQISENERNQSLLIDVAERMNRLAALVAEYRPDVRLPAIRLSPALSKRSSTLPLHSAVLAQKLLALASDAAAAPHAALTTSGGAAASAAAQSSRDTGAIPVVSSTQLVIPANNRRVPLAHERGGENGRTRGGGNAGGGGGRHAVLSADVAGISSHAARALLHAGDQTTSSPHASPDGAGGPHRVQRRRRSSATAGAGFIEGQDDGDDAQLATVAAVPPAGGRVLDFDVDSSVSSDGRVASDASSQPFAGTGDAVDDAETSTVSPTNAGARRRRRSSAKNGAGGRNGGGAGASSTNLNARGGAANTAAGGAASAEDDQEDPLRREEVKKMSEAILERRRRDAQEAARK